MVALFDDFDRNFLKIGWRKQIAAHGPSPVIHSNNELRGIRVVISFQVGLGGDRFGSWVGMEESDRFQVALFDFPKYLYHFLWGHEELHWGIENIGDLIDLFTDVTNTSKNTTSFVGPGFGCNGDQPVAVKLV